MGNTRAYIDQLGLLGEPFLCKVSEATFFSYEALSRCLDMLKEALGGDEKLVLVKGGSGSGKTLLLKQLLACDEKNWRTCTICPDNSDNTEQQDQEGEAEQADQEEQADQADREEQEEQEEGGYDAYLFETSTRSVVMLDDAHLLSLEDLEFLLNLAGLSGHGEEVGQLILFCRPEIDDLMDVLPCEIPEGWGIREIDMPPLDLGELKAYIKRRFRSAGYTGPTPFTSRQLKDIYLISGGYPGRINEVAQHLLENGEFQVKKKSGLFGFFSR